MFLINEPELGRFAKQTIIKMWGREYVIVNNDTYCCKILKILPGFRSSVHAHFVKDETFVGISGSVNLKFYKDNGDWETTVSIHSGSRIRIPPGQFHSFEAQTLSWVLEVSTTHEDSDVTRLAESVNLNAEIDKQRLPDSAS